MPDYEPLMPEEQFEKLLEREIRRGGARTGYSVIGDSDVIVKMIHGPFVGPNMMEWFVWNAVSGGPWALAFGACISISPTGKYLMMERLDNLAEGMAARLPKVPDWVRDAWPNNFGVNPCGAIKIRDFANIDLRGGLSCGGP
jgi:hypothetical protein